MLEPVKCPKCRNMNHVARLYPNGYSTYITCSHFSETIAEYERMRKLEKDNAKRIMDICKPEIDRVLEEEGLSGSPMPRGLEGLRFNSAGEPIYEDDEGYADALDPIWDVADDPGPWNCRCRIEPIQGLGYSVVPHPVPSGVKGFMYGYR